MKKIIAIILAAILLTVPFTSLAHYENDNAGSIPKTATAPTIDGVRDDLYNNALHIPVKTAHSATPDGGLGGGAESWLLWDDEFVYIFMDIATDGPLYHPDDYDQQLMDSPWALTCIELMMDFTNEAEGREDLVKFRLTDSAFQDLSVGFETLRGEESKPYYSSASVKTDNNYTVEIKGDIKALKAVLESFDGSFGSAWAADKQIGLYVFAQEVSADGATALFISVPTDRSGNNAPPMYDYVTLSGTVVNEPAAADDADAVEDVVEDEAVDAPAATDAPTKPAAPKTGDTTAVIFIMFAIALSVAVVFARKAKKNNI